MTRVTWNGVGERFFETGVDRGMLYVPGYASGFPWNGLVNVTEKRTGGDPVPYYLDGIKYLNVPAKEEFAASIEAFTYPREFAECDGTYYHAKGGLGYHQQYRKWFNFSYRTRVGNDLEGIDHGYLLHLVYNALASPTERAYATLQDDADPTTFTWDITTTPQKAVGMGRTAHITIDSRTTDPFLLRQIESILYGNVDDEPSWLTITQLKTLFDTWVTLTITDNGNGTWTATGPDEIITMLDATTFQIDWPSAVPIDENSYTIQTL